MRIVKSIEIVEFDDVEKQTEAIRIDLSREEKKILDKAKRILDEIEWVCSKHKDFTTDKETNDLLDDIGDRIAFIDQNREENED